MEQLVVGISDLKVGASADTLVTYALGSCVGICLWDPSARIGGLSHIMLPLSTLTPGDRNIMKYADTAIPELVRQMERRGAAKPRMRAKIAGGAQMFQVSGGANSSMWQIGQRNVSSVVETLHKLGIPLMAQDVHDNYGRTVFFAPGSGIMTIKAVNRPVKEL